ncbi:hypothetical protein [Nocardia tengchongensis]
MSIHANRFGAIIFAILQLVSDTVVQPTRTRAARIMAYAHRHRR